MLRIWLVIALDQTALERGGAAPARAVWSVSV
jgi:hypothetical protein